MTDGRILSVVLIYGTPFPKGARSDHHKEDGGFAYQPCQNVAVAPSDPGYGS
jgi:hypothetical protein